MLEKFIVKQIKKQEKQLDDWLNSRSVPNEEGLLKEGVILVDNIDYFGDKKTCHKMEVLKPINQDIKGVLINIHGGGLLLGKKEENHASNVLFAKEGFIVYSLNYPLAPEAKFQEILRSLIVGINKVSELENSKEIILFGDSAGAYLSVYLAAMKRNPKIAEAMGSIGSIIPEIKALGLISGMFYTTQLDSIGIFLPKLVYGANYKKASFYPCLNPENPEIIAFLPPCFLVTGKGDFLRHYSRNYAKALSSNENDNIFLDMESKKKLPHAFVALFPELEESKIIISEMVSFFLSNINKAS